LVVLALLADELHVGRHDVAQAHQHHVACIGVSTPEHSTDHDPTQQLCPTLTRESFLCLVALGQHAAAG
jgi:hypothetical protein